MKKQLRNSHLNKSQSTRTSRPKILWKCSADIQAKVLALKYTINSGLKISSCMSRKSNSK